MWIHFFFSPKNPALTIHGLNKGTKDHLCNSIYQYVTSKHQVPTAATEDAGTILCTEDTSNS